MPNDEIENLGEVGLSICRLIEIRTMRYGTTN